MTPEPTKEIFKDDAVRLLQIQSQKCSDLVEYFNLVDELANDGRYLTDLPTPIEWTETLTVGDEAANARMIFSDIGPRDRVFASDPRLWTYLALVTHRDFMSKRWSLPDEDFTSNLQRRWLVPQMNARNLVRHGIARLWWIPFLTYDDNLEHPLSSQSV